MGAALPPEALRAVAGWSGQAIGRQRWRGFQSQRRHQSERTRRRRVASAKAAMFC